MTAATLSPSGAGRSSKVARTVLVIVSGPPGSGKTTLGHMIARRFGLPFISKDGIKEPLGEALGVGDLAWSRKLGVASFTVLYAVCETLLEAGVSHVIEGNFRPEFSSDRFRGIISRYGCEPFEILCGADPGVLLERYRLREERGERHPVHIGGIRIEELREALEAKLYGPLDLGGVVFTLDTTDFDALEYTPLFAALHAALERE